uniref:CAZy families GH36 protein n=1 Tax=uncultured Streptococcus sp. TaxID=83427 RepID=A0A060BN70_9STRE|nr:CAZy families GH36 protein [uncultured Streptococcus sp.]
MAFFGDLGYELDLSAASTAELAEMRDQISFYVSHREVLQRGVLSRLASPYGRGWESDVLADRSG